MYKIDLFKKNFHFCLTVCKKKKKKHKHAEKTTPQKM